MTPLDVTTPLDFAVENDHLLNYVAGRWTPSSTGKTRSNVNPADTRDVIGEFTESGASDVRSSAAPCSPAPPG